MGRLWIILLVMLLLAPVKNAGACMNATMSAREAHAELKEAEEALEIGDVATAHRLARRVMGETEGELSRRAIRVDALATIRDPNATPKDIRSASSSLHEIAFVRPAMTPTEDVTLIADLGEAYAAGGKDDDAYELLGPLAEKDLLGSAYANGALSRIAKRRGEAKLSETTRARCLLAAPSPAVCDGAYPQPSRLWLMLSGKPSGYLAPGFVLLGALGLGRLLVRRKQDALGASFTAARAFGRRSFRTWVASILVGVLAALALRVANEPALATFVAVVAGLAAIMTMLDMRSFVRAVADGRVPAFSVRPAMPEDARLPEVKLLFVRAPTTIERLEIPSYREGARTPLVRVVPRRAKVLVALGVFGAIATILVALLGGILAFRGSEPPPPQADGVPL